MYLLVSKHILIYTLMQINIACMFIFTVHWCDWHQVTEIVTTALVVFKVDIYPNWMTFTLPKHCIWQLPCFQFSKFSVENSLKPIFIHFQSLICLPNPPYMTTTLLDDMHILTYKYWQKHLYLLYILAKNTWQEYITSREPIRPSHSKPNALNQSYLNLISFFLMKSAEDPKRVRKIPLRTCDSQRPEDQYSWFPFSSFALKSPFHGA